MFWWDNILNTLLEAHHKNRLSHALLFIGRAGLGKKEFAIQFAHYLFCSSAEKKEKACGLCRDCILFNAKTHGDFYCLDGKAEKSIGIESIRNIKEAALHTASRGKIKIFLILNAEKLTLSASNALLKILEEPPLACFFILSAESRSLLAPTILSRCQSYSIGMPPLEKMIHWLSLELEQKTSLEMIKKALVFSFNSPFLAKSLLKENKLVDLLTYSEALKNYFYKRLSLFDLYKLFQGKALKDILSVVFITCYELLKNDQSLNKKIIYAFLNSAIKIKKEISLHASLNESLLLDLLFNQQNKDESLFYLQHE